MLFKSTTALKKLLGMRKKIRDVRGSTGAGKTIGITMWDIDYAQSHPNQIIDIVSESYPHLDQGVMRDFKNIMLAQNYWNPKQWNETHHLYEFETGSKIQFQSYDKLGKAHGPRRDVLHLNEANYLPWSVVDQLITRTRKIVWAEYNPSEEFWMHEHILGKREDVESLKLTYLDNEGLSLSEVGEIESHKNNPRWWRVYGLGEIGEMEGRVYAGWKIIDEVPHEARLERYGLDFGYTNDPTAICAVYYFNGGYIVDELVYQKGLSNKQIADNLINLKKALVVADSAEPKSIDELRLYGLNVIGAQKGQGSVSHGIQVVQDQQMSLTKRSVNFIKSYRNYMWLKDKEGRVINEPDHTWSDPMDSIRYAMESLAPALRLKELRENMPRRERKVRLNPAR